MHKHSKHNQEVPQEEASARMNSPKTKKKSQSTQVSLQSSRPIKTDAETQSEIPI